MKDLYEHKDARVPASIRNNPYVMRAVLGADEGSDYKYFVELKRGHVFTCGAKEGGTGGGFNSVKDFKYANPQQA